MKSINNYIQEALIKKGTKLNPLVGDKLIIDIVLKTITKYFNKYISKEDLSQDEYFCDELIKITNEWIKDYNVQNIKSICVHMALTEIYNHLYNQVKKNSPDILNLLKNIDRDDIENDLMIHIIDGAVSYSGDNPDLYSIEISGNSMGLCFEFNCGRIGFMTQDKFDSI